MALLSACDRAQSTLEHWAMRMSLQPSIQGAVAIRCVDSDQGMEDLHQPWLALQEADEHASVFLTWEWMHSWWVNYGRRQPQIGRAHV